MCDRHQLDILGYACVKRISNAANDDVCVPGLIVGNTEGEVGFGDPAAVVGDAFSLESLPLELHVQLELHDHIRSGAGTGDVLEVFSEHRVSTSGVRCVSNTLAGLAVEQFCLLTEEVALYLFITLQILRFKKLHQFL